MNKIPNRQAVCDALVEAARQDPDIFVLCSDSRGSASLGNFIDDFPEHLIEVGIAEQDLVGIAAGMAHCGRKAFAVSPASFLSARSYEQIKVDVCYSDTNVKLIGISGGVSYGALGMSHHSAQDIAAMSSIPNQRVYLPSDRFQTKALITELLKDEKPAYIRVGRNAVEDVYTEYSLRFELDKASVLRRGSDVALIACGEMVCEALKAAELLEKKGIGAYVVDMYCLKPLDEQAVIDAAKATGLIVTVEEHVRQGGLNAAVAQCVSRSCPCRVEGLTLPDEPVIAGKSSEVFAYYGLDGKGIAQRCMELTGRK